MPVEEDGCLVLKGRLGNWQDIVKAGRIAVTIRGFKGRYRGLVNKIALTGGTIPPAKLPPVMDSALEGLVPDVLVIGAGITGAAIARELTRYKLKVLLVEKEHDVGMQASGRNDGMVHSGLDLKPGTQKHYYNKRGNRMYACLARELGVPFTQSGQYLCFTNPLLIPFLYLTYFHWKRLEVPGARVVLKKELRQREPGVNRDVVAALHFPTTGAVCPFTMTIAFAENAVQNGAQVSLDTAVLGMEKKDRRVVSVKTNRGTVYPKVVVNAAGVFSDDVAAMAGDQFFSIHPRRGTNSILDKKISPHLVRTSASKLGDIAKSTHSKGGGLITTAHGNLLVGPDAVETYERENYATAKESVDATFAKFRATAPALNQGQIITYFTGVRAPTYEEDFVVSKGHNTVNIVHAAGIQSPGLTAAPAIAVDAARFAAEILGCFFDAPPAMNEAFNPVRDPIPHVAAMDENARHELIQRNPDYGIILCRCEEVSKGEILDALRRPIPCDTVDGVKRRVRPGMGRCQGGFCGPLILNLIATEKNIPLEAVTKNGRGSVLCGQTKSSYRTTDKVNLPGNRGAEA
ncbi:MAG: NAD(P)/FAD-dependent oxidoreductase [Treponema sp.]|nr:NAD(P)/FAD-dependent oxidoreductase [Treponema sp.]